MLHRSISRVLLAFLCSVAVCLIDYLIQTRLPREGPRSSFEDSWWYRALNWTVPPEGQRGVAFAIDTGVAIIAATVILYVIFTRWERRLAAKRKT